MKTIKKIISIALLLALMISPFVRNWGGGQLFVLPVSAADSGNFGTNDSLSYTFDEGTGELTIDGTGAMPDWTHGSWSPWHGSETSITSVIIKASVTSIGASAFQSCENLTSVTISGSVTSIGASAFLNCGSLTSVEIPDSVTSIGNMAFQHSGLTSVIIPDSVTSIGDGAFGQCVNLASVTIPNSVTSIGAGAFFNCANLTSVTFLSSTPPTFGTNVFLNVDLTKLTITVPQGSERAYSGTANFPVNLVSSSTPQSFLNPPPWIPPVQQDEAAEEEPPEVVEVTDDTKIQEVERNGVLHATLTAANIAALRSDDGVILLTFEGHEDIRLTLVLEAFEAGDMLVIVTDFGTLRISGSVLKSIREKTVTLSIKKT